MFYHTDLVSVVVIFLNGGTYLEEAIISVLNQNYQNWELILVDDGSIDCSTKIAKEYSSKNPKKIHYLEHENHQNLGMSASRNLGISHAQGEYISFLDADDIWLSCKLEQQVSIMKAYPEVALISGRTRWWYSWTGKPEDKDRDFLQKFDLPLNTVISPPDLLIQFLKDEWASLCDVMVSRSAVKKVGGYEESFRGMYEDQAFHSKLCLRFPVFLSSQCWYLYRQHSQACTAASHNCGQTNLARFRFLTWLEQHLSHSDHPHPSVWRTVQNELWRYRHPYLYRLVHYFKSTMKSLFDLAAPLQRYWPLPLSNRPSPPVGAVRLGQLRRLTPISRQFGYDRGLPIDRYYIENFLNHYSQDIKGRVLEIGDDSYTRQFGGTEVTQRDVLHVKEGNSVATFVGDLTQAEQIPSNAFDCFILTQTLHLVYDFHTALKTIYRILKPGGIVLATVPGISQKCDDEWANYWCWSFTAASGRQLFEECFPADHIRIDTYGNVLAATAFLQGLCAKDLTLAELDYCDSHYELLITVRAVKPEKAE